MTAARLYKTSKSVIVFKNNPVSFLNGITSNTADVPRNAFLNVHGKIVATFDQVKLSEDEVWICIEAPFVDSLLAHIQKYVILNKVVVEQPDRRVYFDLDGTYALSEGELAVAQKQGQLVISARDLDVNVGEEEFTRFRLDHGIALHGVDYTDDFILNVSTDEFVSFTKGCFLGQEPVSKVYNRSRPTWRLVVKYLDQIEEGSREKFTSKTVDPESGRARGFLFVKNTET